ncbi:MAG: anti-phage dCTP deaminase [Clostridiaceae bacterium]
MAESLDIALENLFNERKDFIIIGLTGRTGSGCSTVADLLTKDFKELNVVPPKNELFSSNEERKYSLVYQYADKNWEKFVKIEMRNIITSFILEERYTKLKRFLKTEYPTLNQKNLDATIRTEFNKMHEERLRIKKLVEENEDNLKDDSIYKFYFTDLPIFTLNLKTELEKHDKDIYTKLYQKIANNIRSSGKALSDEFNAENIFMLSQRTNTLIKILRKRNKEAKNKNKTSKGRVLVVIDAFRNPYEAIFFKDRYSSFYLFSINTKDEDRKKRLNENIDLINKQIKAIDEIEYPKNLSGNKIFWSQNIQRCIELSDVYMYNPQSNIRELKELKSELIKYITLIMHPGLVSPTHVERSMQIAYNAKLNSGCLSRQVGAVVTDENYSIKSVGWNTIPEGQIPCNLRSLNKLVSRQDKEAYSNFELNNQEFITECETIVEKINNDKLNGRSFQYCFKDIYNNTESKKGEKNQVYTRSLHAEENAFLQISKYGGMGIMGGNLFTTASPCELCAKKAYQLGIKKIYYIDPYPGISEDHILMNGIKNPVMILFQGAIGRGFTQLYTQIMPYKDELKMLLND